MESKGLEIGVNLVPIQTKDWEWNISGNFTWNASKITKLNTIDNESNYVKDVYKRQLLNFPKVRYYVELCN